MLVGRTRVGLLGAGLAALGALAAVACSSTGQATGASSVAAPPCPTSYADVASATCTVEGQQCVLPVPCAVFPASATCTCSGGQFACTASDSDAAPGCVALSTTEMCPRSELSANGLFCSEMGLICTYPSACPSVPTFDTCQCVGGLTAAQGPHFECSMACEVTDGGSMPTLDDAGAPDGRAPGVADAAVDSAPSIDGAGDP
jgi:hypothetical protein